MISEVEVAFGVSMLRNSGKLLFTSKENRDAVWKAAKAAGITGLIRGSIANQQLDPRYTFEGRTIPDRGLANDYRHWFPKLYRLETSRW